MTRLCTLGIVLVLLWLVTMPAWALGPFESRVIRVLDGDTIEVEAQVWLGQVVRTVVRFDGVDAPELRGKCEFERMLARDAKLFVEQRVSDGVTIDNVRPDKYGDRVLATVKAKGADLGPQLIAAGLGRVYHGEQKGGWCN
jgi:endonuclease YncB( thermonuclease family)